MLEINSPTVNDIYCAISVVPATNPEKLTLYVFGDNGLGYISNDKCATWQTINVDPLHRSIRKAIWVNDTLMVVSGGTNNNLLKYSTDKGITFKDLTLSSGGQVNTVSYMARNFVLFHQATQLISWDIKNNTFTVVTSHVSVQCPEFYDGTSTYGKPLVVSKKTVQLGDGPYSTYFVRKGYSSYLFTDWGISAPFHDLITSITTTATRDLVSFRGKTVGQYVYQGSFDPGQSTQTPALVYFPTLTKDQAIKSSCIVPKSQAYWHCGGDDFGANGFIIKAGAVIKTVPDFVFNFIAPCAYVSEEGTQGSSDNVVVVGSKGKIFSDRTDLSAPILPIKDDYLVSDETVIVGDSARVTVSGSEINILYKVYKATETIPVYTFLGDGKSWSFKVLTLVDATYNITATRNSDVVKLKDVASIKVNPLPVDPPKTDYVVSDPMVNAGDSAKVTVSGSEIGVVYKVFEEGTTTPIIFTFNGDGKAWSFSVLTLADKNYFITATKGTAELKLKDIASVTLLVNIDYVVSDPKVKPGETALIQVSGSQKGLEYLLAFNGELINFKAVIGTGGPIEMPYKAGESIVLQVYVKYGTKVAILKDLANVTVEPTGVITVDLLKLAAFPNPCYDIITVNSGERSTATLIDQVGRTVMQLVLDQGRNELSVADLKPGLYFLTTQKHVFKLLKR